MELENEDIEKETEDVEQEIEGTKSKTAPSKPAKPHRYLRLFLLFITVCVVGCIFYIFVASPCHIKKPVSVYVLPTDNQEQVLEKVQKAGKIKNMKKLTSILNSMDYKHHIRSGRYLLKPGMSSFRIARILRSGMQTPIKLTFNNIRTVEDLAGRLSKQLMTDSVSLLKCFKDSSWAVKMGLNRQNYMCVFIPDTYEIYWNVAPSKVLKCFQNAYYAFWDEDRQNAAKQIGLTPVQVCTLASIVEEETNKTDEMPRVAGLYLNRLRIGMPLQADPTIKFAVGDFSLKRILKGHVQVSSPYNTYKHTGLPPGPIRLPSIKAVKAVLSPSHHSYIYMCAKDDFSGYHAFASTLAEHNANAAKYHQALNESGILQ